MWQVSRSCSRREITAAAAAAADAAAAVAEPSHGTGVASRKFLSSYYIILVHDDEVLNISPEKSLRRHVRSRTTRPSFYALLVVLNKRNILTREIS